MYHNHISKKDVIMFTKSAVASFESTYDDPLIAPYKEICIKILTFLEND